MEVLLVIGIIALAMFLFIREHFPASLVAMMVLCLLMLVTLLGPLLPGFQSAHWVSTADCTSGFANHATLSVLGMFLLSAGLQRTGLIEALGRRLGPLAKYPTLLISLLLGTCFLFSGFVNNTAAVAVFIPLLAVACSRSGIAPSRVMLPLSYASQVGGVCTLIGTSTNLLVAGIAEERGLKPFGLFDFLPLGLTLALLTAVYFAFFGRLVLPKQGGAPDPASAEIRESATSPVPDKATRRRRMILSLSIFVSTVALASSNLVPLIFALLLGVILLFATRCLTLEEAFEFVDWRVITLLGCMLPLGIAIEKSGAAALLAGWTVELSRPYGPIAALALIYIVTTVLTEMMSNNATSVLLAPVAIAMATQLGISPQPLLVAVCFAASTSFCTPVGYQTNAMVQGPGGYRFADYMRAGLPLNLAFLGVSIYMIPRLWPF